jgi:hypothetical protein
MENIMRITIQQASDILSRTEDEILFIANIEKRIPIEYEADNDMEYNEDGTVRFIEGASTDPCWWFTLQDVLDFKKQMDEGLVGKVEEILENK